jgi:pyruvate dehydrogenase E2 component (dihydrolipoamide acetyltransferase)
MNAATMRVFTLPDLGEGLAEAEIVHWRVAVGDIIAIDQIVVEVETAKAIVDVPCPYPGRVVALHGSPGELRPVGQPLITVAPADAGDAGDAPDLPEARSGNVLVGYGTDSGQVTRRRRPRQLDATIPSTVVAPPASSGAALVISPLVRRAARDAGIDVTALRGSGPGGMIRRADVNGAAAAAAAPVVDGPVAGDPHEVVIELRGVRGAIAEKLSRSRREIPDVTIWVDVDATGLLETRAALNAGYPDRSVSLVALLARICVDALERYPALNSRVDTSRQEIVRSSRIHIGVATSTPRGLVVPVVKDAQQRNLLDLADNIGELTTAARAGTLAPAKMTGGTFTLNNYGVFGVDGSTPIINHPEAALFGIGRIVDKPWVVAGQLAVRKVAQISLTFDHRVCDGEVAGGFLRHVADRIEQPTLLLATH